MPVSCRFLVLPRYTNMSGSALCSVALFFTCFRKHHTLLQSGHGKLYPAHQHNKARFSQWPVLHFWFLRFFQDGHFDQWEVRLLCSADLHVQLAWLAKKGVCVFSWGKNAYALFGQVHHCRRFATFHVLSRRVESTSWNLFPAILHCFQILIIAFPQYICGQELSFITLQVCELQCPWAPFFNSIFGSWLQKRRIASGPIVVPGGRLSLWLILLPDGKIEWPVLVPTPRASLSLVPPLPVHA